MQKKPHVRINWPAIMLFVCVNGLWQLLSTANILPAYMVPSPSRVIEACIEKAPVLASHGAYTLAEALLGLAIGVAVGFLLAVVMDEVRVIKRALSPLVTVSQTIPTIAIAPLLILWLGYGMLPKIVLVALTTFFPITVSLVSAFAEVSQDHIDMMRMLGANRWQILLMQKLPAARESFFAGLKISATYAVVGAVIAEWLGGFMGLGVAMERARKSYAYAEMFACVLVISLVSLGLLGAVSLLDYATAPWKRAARKRKQRAR